MPRTKSEVGKEKMVCRTVVPTNMIDGPHIIFFNGVLVNPGKDNDYTIQKDNGKSYITWWNSEILKFAKKNEVNISIVRVDSGNRWGFSNSEGVFLDTRKS